MATIARRRRRGDRSPVLSFWIARRASVLLGLAVLLGIATAVFGLQEAPVPTSQAGTGTALPVWRLLAFGVGTLPVLGLHSPLGSLEEARGHPHSACEWRYLVALITGCSASYLALASVSLNADSIEIIARSIPGWVGLALLSGRILGWRLGWILPVLGLAALTYWGAGTMPATFAWWEFTARPPDDLIALFLSSLLLVAGGLAFAATPWRVRRIIGRRVVRLRRPGITGPCGAPREGSRHPVTPPARRPRWKSGSST